MFITPYVSIVSYVRVTDFQNFNSSLVIMLINSLRFDTYNTFDTTRPDFYNEIGMFLSRAMPAHMAHMGRFSGFYWRIGYPSGWDAGSVAG